MDNLETRLVTVLQHFVKTMAEELEQKRQHAVAWGRHPEWPWNAFIISYSTFGRSANWDDRIALRYDAEFSWKALENADDETLSARFADLPNPNRRHIVTPAIADTYRRFKEAGGPAGMREKYEFIPTADGRIAFLKTFAGIGNKYGRNIPMDSYDELVRDQFAIDHQLKKILAALGLSAASYGKQENELRRIAGLVPCDGWTLDRIMYAHADEILAQLGVKPERPKPTVKRKKSDGIDRQAEAR